jgi:exopolyphosphatase/guanosine-5'-triphosphate,3'-diphosphate pyrophosphatase
MSRFGTDSRKVTRLSSLRRWVTDHLGDIRHERRVSSIASALVDATAHFHRFSLAERRLLRMAVLVHDVGRCVDDRHHPAIGAQMILDQQSLPLKRRERRALAYLTKYHRGQVPALGEDDILRDGDDREGLLMLLGFLRAADCLDSRALPSQRVSVSARGSRVRIHCQIPEESAKARRIYTRRKKFRLLEQMLACAVEVNVECPRRLRMVA